MTRGMDFVRKMRWKLNGNTGRRLSQPDMDPIDSFTHWRSSWSTQNTPRGSIDSASVPEGLIMPSSSTSSHHEKILILPPIHELTNSSNREAYADQYNRALHTPTRFLPQNQSVITTNAEGAILLFNDIASLCFDINKSIIGKSVLTSLLEEPFRKQITNILSRRRKIVHTQDQSDKGLVLVCGTIIPIIKANTIKSVASLWLKEKKTDHGEHIYIWIFEEIYDTSLSVYVDSKCIIRRVLGTMIEIYGYQENDIIGKPVNCLVPALSKEKRDDNLEKIDRLKFFGSQSSQGIYYPVILNLSRHVAIGDDDLSSFVVKITSLPTISGLMTINRKNGLVKSLNPVPAKYLFGYSVSTIIDEKKIQYKDLIPHLPILINTAIEKGKLSNKSIMENDICKKILQEKCGKGEPSTIYVVHRDGSQFEVELQLKLVESNLVNVWITYDRIDAVAKYKKRSKKEEAFSQVTRLTLDEKIKTKQRIAKLIYDNTDQGLLVSPITERNTKDDDLLLDMSIKKLRKPATQLSRISSFGAMDDRRKLFPSDGTKTNTIAKTVTNNDMVPLEAPLKELKKHPLDDYVILEVLGQGTYGTAKLAYRKDDPSQKKLVIKHIIKSKIIVDSWIRDRQLGSIPMEIHILKALQKYPHPNCCRLVTSLEDEDHYFIVMELLGDGMDLFDYIEINKNMTENEIQRIFYQVACAVKHLHQHKIVHRDIKDENIILDQEGKIHLIDFGCATYYKKDRKFDTFTGTLEYCAPEVLKGKPYEGPPQDIWASGILLFTLIYRENPFYNIDEIMERELRVPYVVSEGSLDLIKKMLDRDIEKRINIDQILEHPWFHSFHNNETKV
ncbi:kinase-like domain-containing protein [Mucor mucedo]|uniref:kinase-like domain-containing protein n=1 Tax=Mucor mucedo TaxID=29922 RepID=UPI002220A1CB|nr:kinase-like domain-containing protein [Mucor mucedo]KAI7894438.1 kinase-like domain-containing protein [Mucor mucedo]